MQQIYTFGIVWTSKSENHLIHIYYFLRSQEILPLQI